MAGLWIYLFKVSWSFEHNSCSKSARAQNMARLWLCEGYSGLWTCLDKTEYTLIMPQYAWICRNSAEHAWICQNSEFVWCSAWHKVTVKINEQLSKQEAYSGHCPAFKMGHFAKRIMPLWRHAAKFVMAGQVFWN